MNTEIIIEKLNNTATRSAKDIKTATTSIQKEYAVMMHKRAIDAINMIDAGEDASVAWNFFQSGNVA